MCYLDEFLDSHNLCNTGTFHYSQVHAFVCETFADGVSKKSNKYLDLFRSDGLYIPWEHSGGKWTRDKVNRITKAKNHKSIIFIMALIYCL